MSDQSQQFNEKREVEIEATLELVDNDFAPLLARIATALEHIAFALQQINKKLG